PGCGCKNHLRARYCNQCGGKLDENRATRDADGRAKLHADIAHPINSACREVIQTAVLKAYHDERERSKQPGYVCTYDDYDGGDFDTSYTQIIGELGSGRGPNYRTHHPTARAAATATTPPPGWPAATTTAPRASAPASSDFELRSWDLELGGPRRAVRDPPSSR